MCSSDLGAPVHRPQLVEAAEALGREHPAASRDEGHLKKRGVQIYIERAGKQQHKPGDKKNGSSSSSSSSMRTMRCASSMDTPSRYLANISWSAML